MAAEVLTPDSTVSSQQWVNEAAGAATFASVDEGIAGDADTTYVEQPQSLQTTGFDCEFGFSDPVGTPDFGTGTLSWALRVMAKYVTGPPTSFSFALYEGATLRAGPFSPALTATYAQYTGLFDPAVLAGATDLRVRITSQADGEGGKARVTAADMSIQVVDASGNGPRDLALLRAG